MNKILIPQMPDFAGIRAPSIDFQEVRDMRRSLPWYVDVDLSTARSLAAGTASIINAAGTVIFIDQDPTVGNGTIHFQDTTQGITSSPIYVAAGSIFQIPFTQLMIENIAQAGKKLRIHFGVDLDFKPSLSSALTLSGTINTSEQGIAYNANFKANSNLAANTAETILLPASNTNGVLILEVNGQSDHGLNGAILGLIAKTSAPANITDGDLLVSSRATTSGSSYVWMHAEPNLVVPAGKGLYFLDSQAQSGSSIRNVSYLIK